MRSPKLVLNRKKDVEKKKEEDRRLRFYTNTKELITMLCIMEQTNSWQNEEQTVLIIFRFINCQYH